MRINGLPLSPLYSNIADFLSILSGTAHYLLISQRLTTSTSRKDVLVIRARKRKDRAGSGVKPSVAARGMNGSSMPKPTTSKTMMASGEVSFLKLRRTALRNNTWLLLHRQSTIEDQHRACRERGLIAGEEKRGVCYLLWCTQSSKWNNAA